MFPLDPVHTFIKLISVAFTVFGTCYYYTQGTLWISLTHFYNWVSVCLCWWLILEHLLNAEWIQNKHVAGGKAWALEARLSQSENCLLSYHCLTLSKLTSLYFPFFICKSKVIISSLYCSVRVIVKINKKIYEGFKVVMIEISSGRGDSSCTNATNRDNLWHLSPLTWNCYTSISLDQTFSKW